MLTRAAKANGLCPEDHSIMDIDACHATRWAMAMEFGDWIRAPSVVIFSSVSESVYPS